MTGFLNFLGENGGQNDCYFDPLFGSKKREFGPEIVLMMTNLLDIYAIPYTIYIPPHKCILVPTF